ncbi:hypothetical protein [Actinokineospora cianjurensis]|uniref:Uncharacterized protein n=1 Tax=Actinokineospora cianjurensis TaxID=585224 RepID=A0A421AX71_9PSEU|nr:hypothetical protein [Actinokineospora cianjurensis]RLK54435.1 hypothetical protein CLV68_5985 [Actinokineospora cianjurensis]
MMTPQTHTNGGTVEPTTWLVELTEAGTAAARWVLGTEEAGVGFFTEDAFAQPGVVDGAAPDEDVADWVAAVLGVSGVELTEASEGHWSVGITG